MNYDMSYHDSAPPGAIAGRASSMAGTVRQASPFDAFALLPGAAQLPSLESSSSETTSQADEEPQLRKSCDYCVKMKRGCDGGTPCELCKRRKKCCVRSVKKRSGPAKGTKYCKRRARKSASEGSVSAIAKAPRTTFAIGAKAAVRRQNDRKTSNTQSPSATNAPVADPVAAEAKRALATTAQPRAENKMSSSTPTTPSTSAAQCDVKKPKTIKRELSRDKELAAPAAAPAVQASHEGWTERGLHAAGPTDSSNHCGSMLPFFPLEQTGDGTATSTSAPSSHGFGLGARNPGQEFPISPMQHGSSQSVASQGWTAWHSGVSQRAGSSTGACSQNGARFVGPRRSSLEEALYGSLDKRPGWIDIQDLDMDVKTISSLRWAHHGTTQDNVNQWIDGGGASGAETGASCSSVSSEFLHPAPGISCSAGQASHGFTFGARSTGGPAAATGTFDAHLSLRDLLLEKWPPVPINEVSLGEATW